MRSFFCLFFALLISSQGSFADAGISLKNNETLTINQDQIITGDIILEDDSVLTIENATVVAINEEGDPREDILLSGNAKLVLENANLVPMPLMPDNLYLNAANNSKIEITNSTFFNVLDLGDNASITGKNAKIISSREPYFISETDGAFGIVQLSGNATSDFTNSIIGSFGIFLGEGDTAELSDLKPQKYDDFNLQRDSMISPKYNIILKNSEVLPVKMEGPFERGWTIFTSPKAKVTVRDSSLNKLVFQQFENEIIKFKNLRLDAPLKFDFKDIHLINTTITNQWGIFGENCDVTIEDSHGVWLWPIDLGTWKLVRSRMNEFDPRRFTGTLIFENAEWAVAGEVFENTDIKLKGTVKFTEDIDKHLVLSDSKITREYPVKVLKKKKRVLAFSLDVFNGTTNVAQAQTRTGEALFSLEFTPENYKQKLELKVNVNGKIKTKEIGLFSNTPAIIKF